MSFIIKNIRDFDDVHTHNRCARPDSIINLFHIDEVPAEGYYSIGIHPWHTANWTMDDADAALSTLESKLDYNNIVAIGECGLDRLKGADTVIQKYIFRRQAQLSEERGLPLIIHNVKAIDDILKIHKEINPAQTWIIHGFRGNATQAKQITDKGICLSFGEAFNPESALSVPENMKFFETDESLLTINEIKDKINNINKC